MSYIIATILIIIISIYPVSSGTYRWAATVTLLSWLHEAISTHRRVQQLKEEKGRMNIQTPKETLVLYV